MAAAWPPPLRTVLRTVRIPGAAAMPPSVDDSGQQFINGRRRRGSSSDPLRVTNPSNGEVVATDTLASVDDVDEAVAAAKAASPGWAGVTPAERSTAMHRLAAELDAVPGE